MILLVMLDTECRHILLLCHNQMTVVISILFSLAFFMLLVMLGTKVRACYVIVP
jgi:hypothetical protein